MPASYFDASWSPILVCISARVAPSADAFFTAAMRSLR